MAADADAATPDEPMPDEPMPESDDGTTGPPPETPDTSDEETSRLMHDLAVANDFGPDPTGTRDGGA